MRFSKEKQTKSKRISKRDEERLKEIICMKFSIQETREKKAKRELANVKI